MPVPIKGTAQSGLLQIPQGSFPVSRRSKVVVVGLGLALVTQLIAAAPANAKPQSLSYSMTAVSNRQSAPHAVSKAGKLTMVTPSGVELDPSAPYTRPTSLPKVNVVPPQVNTPEQLQKYHQGKAQGGVFKQAVPVPQTVSR
jgi:hypothetical protein